MNLGWLVAVLRPRDVAPNPSFPDAGYDSSPVARLAAVMIDDIWLLRQSRGPSDIVDTDDVSLTLVTKSLMRETISEGTFGLVQQILYDSVGDAARLCALTLVVCSAAAELDDYETCDRVLSSQVASNDASTSDLRLIKAALLQQFSLRLRDSGRPYLETSFEAAKLLNEVDIHACSAFSVNPCFGVSHVTTLNHVITALRQSIWSLVPPSERSGSSKTQSVGPSIAEQIQLPPSEQLLRIDRRRAGIYAKFLEMEYKRVSRSRSVVLSGPSRSDLFHAVLPLEFLGHIDVYQARKELALMRLIQDEANGLRDVTSDALRLLRHSGAAAELDLALDRIRAGGPLAVLSEDARQILRHRAKPHLMRVVELRILQSSAELLTVGEARDALAVVKEVISSGGPSNAPGWRQLQVLGLEAAWLAAAMLANTAETPDEVARLLLDAAVEFQSSGEQYDRAIGRALRQLDWKNVSEHTATRWVNLFRSGKLSMPATAHVVRLLVGVDILGRDVESWTLETAANELNMMMRTGSELPAEAVDRISKLVRDSLATIQSDAHRGTYSLRPTSAAELAAVLIHRCDVDSLWLALATLLLDSAVSRDDRTQAFDRLSIERPPMPPGIAHIFRDNWQELLLARPFSAFEGDEAVPYPAALRFLANYDLIEGRDIFTHLAHLAGSSSPDAREEAARTVAVLAANLADMWLLSFAAQLSHDGEVSVKAHAAGALAKLASVAPDLEPVASGRVIELLGEDGLLVPLYVLRSLAGVSAMPISVKDEVLRLRNDHPSRLVREQAGLLTENGH